jgi:hypothetical protein
MGSADLTKAARAAFFVRRRDVATHKCRSTVAGRNRPGYRQTASVTSVALVGSRRPASIRATSSPRGIRPPRLDRSSRPIEDTRFTVPNVRRRPGQRAD